MFDRYLDLGGNIVDTADIYARGRSEELLGHYIVDRQARDRVVLATKCTWNMNPGNPNAGGNGRKNIHRALEQSLARLQTDYIDLYWLHIWDMVTPVEEVLETMAGLVRAGKIRYYALSDVPAWYATKMAVMAAERGLPGPIALQMEYSLVERGIENEYVPLARETGMGIMPWSPLAGGFLSGKYQPDAATGAGRLHGANPFGQSKFNERNWEIVDALKLVAAELEVPPAQVALAWARQKRGVDCVLVGAKSASQLDDNLASLTLDLSPALMTRLDAISQSAPMFPYSAFTADIGRGIFGGAHVTGW
jgi:aryl-alcohol dehydrogenase-like predicted oxidoreductase